MLYRISVLDKGGLPLFYRRPFSGLSEIEPALLTELASAIKAEANIVAENEIFSVRVLNDLYAIVSHDGDDVGVEQVYSGISEYINESTSIVPEELERSIRLKLKPSANELLAALDELYERTVSEKLTYKRPSREASESEMRELFLSGRLDQVIDIFPRTSLMAAIYIKAAMFLEVSPSKYPRADPQFLDNVFSVLADRRVEKYLRACLEHVRDPLKAHRRHITLRNENRSYFMSLIARDPIRAPILLYPVNDQELYKLVLENFTGYRRVIAKTYHDLHEAVKKRSVESMLKFKPRGEGLERLATLTITAFARDMVRYIAADEDADLLLSEAPLIAKRFNEYVELLSKDRLVPIPIYAYALGRFASHIYRLVGLALSTGRKPSRFAGIRKSIDKAMKYLSDVARSGIVKSFLLASILGPLTEAMYAVTKARGEKFDPKKMKHLKISANALASTIDSRGLAILESRSDPSSFMHITKLAISLTKLYGGLVGGEAMEYLRKALERSLLSIYVEEMPLILADILDALATAYARSKPPEYTVREIVGYAKRMGMRTLILRVILRRMMERFKELGYDGLASIVEEELKAIRIELKTPSENFIFTTAMSLYVREA